MGRRHGKGRQEGTHSHLHKTTIMAFNLRLTSGTGATEKQEVEIENQGEFLEDS